MGEANLKPTSFDVLVTTGDRYLISKMMSANTRCPTCKSGPVNTTEPMKLIRFGKLWDSLNLNEFEDLTSTELQNKLSEPSVSQEITVNLSSELFKFLVEIVFQQASTIFNLAPLTKLLDQLTEIVDDNNINVAGYTHTDLPTKEFKLEFTNKELDALFVTFLSPQTCKEEFRTQDGAIVAHGQATDYPIKTINEYLTYTDLVDQLDFKKLLTGTGQFTPFDGVKEYKFDELTIAYLKDIITRRSTSTPYPPTKFIGIINKLEEATK